MANKRITDQTTDTALTAGDYIIVDSSTEGTRKFDLGSELADIKADFAEFKYGGGGLTDEARYALLDCFQQMPWFTANSKSHYDALAAALFPVATLSSITCVYTQSGTVYESDSLDSLKTDLVVTAHYSDQSTTTVTNYTLSGTLTEGTSTITVSYSGKTTTFNVAVTADTTANIETEGYVLSHYTSGDPIRNEAKTYGGITIKYDLDSATTALALSGIIPYTSTDAPLTNTSGAIVVYDSNGDYVNYVYERMSNGNRWAQDASGTMTEYSQSWTVSSFSKIAFSVDIRHLDDAYMYHSTTGQVFFAGKNTPYFGMSNISEAQ